MSYYVDNLSDSTLQSIDEYDLKQGKEEWHQYCLEEGLEEESEDCPYEEHDEFQEGYDDFEEFEERDEQNELQDISQEQESNGVQPWYVLESSISSEQNLDDYE